MEQGLKHKLPRNLLPSTQAAQAVSLRLSTNIRDGGHYDTFFKKRQANYFADEHQKIWAEIASNSQAGTVEFASGINSDAAYSGLTASQVGTNDGAPLAIEPSAKSGKFYKLSVSRAFTSIDIMSAETTGNTNASAGKVGLVVTAFARAIGFEEYPPDSGVSEFKKLEDLERITIRELNQFGVHASKAF